MLWPQAASSTQSQPAPSAEALRVATLQASWVRDRQVARRRLAWRWLVWAWWRYLLPSAVVLGSAAWLVTWLMPEANRLLARQLAPAASQTASPAPLQPTRPAPMAPDPQLTAEGEPLELGRPDQDALVLRLDSRWAAPQIAPPASPLPSEEDVLLVPILMPENWLHSKEP
ncbi:hypothetical protein [Hydrogenophaga sp.]|uniref:hypothetical protein n=1 Tax=Hydrogenophaga sp. TaxID=1904254 RepID=UPI0025BCCCCD|nr:hypothetical protein [Hydrogenophaga sp.]